MERRILITGVPGWLGTRLVEVLTGGEDPLASELNPSEIRAFVLPGSDMTSLERAGVRPVIGDLRQGEGLDRVTEGIDCVLHLAGIIHPRRLSDFYEINTEGTRRLIRSAVRSGVSRFVFMSSNSAAGSQRRRGEPMTELTPSRPYLNYGRSKRLAEEIVLKAHASGEIEGVILRSCWYYGPGQPERQTRFFKMIREGHPVLFGDGRNLRSMAYLDNVIQGLLLAALREKAAGGLYWITDERPYTTLEVYETIGRLLGVSRLSPRRLPSGTSGLCRIADSLLQRAGLYQQEVHVAGEMTLDLACSIEKAKRELGYQPRIELEEGMRRSIEWCRRRGLL